MTDLEILCRKLNIRATSHFGNNVANMDDWQRAANPWTVAMRYRGRKLTVPFWQGWAITKEPTAADVLSCLCSDARLGELDFEEFCSELGYNNDSRKAEKAWKACQKTLPRLQQFLGDDFEQVCSAEH